MTPRSDPHTEAILEIRRKRDECAEIEKRGKSWSYKPVALKLADIDTLLAALAALESERDEAREHVVLIERDNTRLLNEAVEASDRAVAAEARVTQLAEKLTKWADQLQFDADTQQAISLTGGDDYGTADEYRNEANRNGTLAARLREIAALGVVADGGGGRDD